MGELCIDVKVLLICMMSGYCSGTYEYQSVTGCDAVWSGRMLPSILTREAAVSSITSATFTGPHGVTYQKRVIFSCIVYIKHVQCQGGGWIQLSSHSTREHSDSQVNLRLLLDYKSQRCGSSIHCGRIDSTLYTVLHFIRLKLN